jgi:hypothetical protein
MRIQGHGGWRGLTYNSHTMHPFQWEIWENEIKVGRRRRLSDVSTERRCQSAHQEEPLTV